MKRVIAGILLAVMVLSLPIPTQAHERQCPPPIEVTYDEAQEKHLTRARTVCSL